jgi:tetratricopeptide (TPR) repeat protein
VVGGERARLLLERAQRTEGKAHIAQARAALERLAEDDPRNGEVLLRLGVARALGDDDAAAEQAWLRADGLAPARAAAAIDLALLYIRQQRWPEARAAAATALRKEPDNERAKDASEQAARDGT